MMNRTTLTAALLATLAAAAAGQTTTNTVPHTQNINKNQTTTPKTTATPTKQVVTDPAVLATMPGHEHLDLSRFTVGDWTATVSFWNHPNAQPVTGTGKAKFYSTMGGRFVGTEFECQFNGQTMKCNGVYGYNNGEKRYESTWVDNQTTAIFFFTGVRQDKTITWNTTYTDPATGAKKNVKSVEVFGDNTINYTMFESTTDGNEFKKLEITYTRTGPGGPVEITPIETQKNTTNTPGTTNNTNNTNRTTPRTPTPNHTGPIVTPAVPK